MNQNILEFLFTITIIQIWWIAVWGFAYMGIELVAGKNKWIESSIYVSFFIIILVILKNRPDLLIHL